MAAQFAPKIQQNSNRYYTNCSFSIFIVTYALIRNYEKTEHFVRHCLGRYDRL
jgi:hypothetical protein